MKLYHCADARSFRVLWTLEELGLPYELETMPFPPRHRVETYLDVNPLGTIPAFVDGDTFMTESAAIAHYLVVRHDPTPLNVAPDDPAYGAFLNWLHFGEATLTFPQTLVLRYRRLEPEERRQPQVADDYAQWFASRLRHVDRALEVDDHLCAGRFTAADISVGYALLLATHLDLAGAFTDRIHAYWERLKARPGYRAARAAQKTSLAA